MYSVYADGVCIYNDAFALDNMKLASPKLTLEDNAAGSFVMTVPPSKHREPRMSRLDAIELFEDKMRQSLVQNPYVELL